MSERELDRDQQILSRLSRIEHKVDSMEQTSAFALRAEADKHFNTIREIFGRSTRRVQVYLAADGVRSVQDIADHLGMRQPNVSKVLSKLQQEGLMEIIEVEGGNSIWAKKAVDRSLRISKFLQDEYSLTQSGLPRE